MSTILPAIEDFLRESKMPPWKFGQLTLNNKRLVTRLREGGDVTTRNAAKIEAFIESERKKLRSGVKA